MPGYSGSDMKNLVKDASMGPLRDALRQGIEITRLSKEDMRPVTLQVNAMLETEFVIVKWMPFVFCWTSSSSLILYCFTTGF